jgi:hypothetical protein
MVDGPGETNANQPNGDFKKGKKIFRTAAARLD